jgi:DNA processing protein
MDENAKYTLALSQAPGIGAAKLTRLVEYFKTTYAVWHASTNEIAQVCGLDKAVVGKFMQYRQNTDIDKEYVRFLKSEVDMVTIDNSLYPASLRHIHNPPPVLFFRGLLVQPEPQAIAIVGSRRCTAYGRHVAEQLARDLTEAGFTVVSGLARGIDTAAHKGALQWGRTIAVLGSGVDVIYPPENKKLFSEITLVGLIVSEYPPGTPPIAAHFPARNRLISGLTCGVVVVEAAEKSGALITVDFALEQGRDVYAVPGCITNPSSVGTNKLIQQGAKLVVSVEDILEEYGRSFAKRPQNEHAVTEMSLEEQVILGHVDITPTGIDQLIHKSGWEAGRIHSILLDLEIKRLIESLPGKRYKLTDAEGLWR